MILKNFFLLFSIFLFGNNFNSSENNIIVDDEPKSSDETTIGPEYFPIDPSLKLSYNSSLGEAEAVIKEDGHRYILNLNNDDFYFVQTVYVENDTIFLTKLEQQIDIFFLFPQL